VYLSIFAPFQRDGEKLCARTLPSRFFKHIKVSYISVVFGLGRRVGDLFYQVQPNIAYRYAFALCYPAAPPAIVAEALAHPFFTPREEFAAVLDRRGVARPEIVSQTSEHCRVGGQSCSDPSPFNHMSEKF
jgi:hypothetical protein